METLLLKIFPAAMLLWFAVWMLRLDAENKRLGERNAALEEAAKHEAAARVKLEEQLAASVLLVAQLTEFDMAVDADAAAAQAAEATP